MEYWVISARPESFLGQIEERLSGVESKKARRITDNAGRTKGLSGAREWTENGEKVVFLLAVISWKAAAVSATVAEIQTSPSPPLRTLFSLKTRYVDQKK